MARCASIASSVPTRAERAERSGILARPGCSAQTVCTAPRGLLRESNPVTEGTVPVGGDRSPARSTDQICLYVCVSGTGFDLYCDGLGNLRDHGAVLR